MIVSPHFEILPMTPLYLDGFWRVLDLVAREGLWLELTEAPPQETLEKRIRNDLSLNNAFYIACDSTEVVGWCAIIREARPHRTHRGRLVMGIHPSWRRRGLGRRLVERCIAHAEAAGIGRIELSVYGHNTIAKHLYETFGFEVEGLHRMTRVLDGRYFDTIDMARLNQGLLQQNLLHNKKA
jgi:ribosomal protein S18 acetylase RimI-like enzyme